MMTLEQQNEFYDKCNKVQLDGEEIAMLLSSGMGPEFRSLSGILQDAAALAMSKLYKELIK